jgi:hypothetical protein
MALLASGRRRTERRAAYPFRVWSVVSAMLLVIGLAVSVQAALSREYQVKAVFLFHFAQFVEWPSPAFPEAQTPLVIGVLGDDPFSRFLDETVRGETVNDHPLVVRRFRSLEEIDTCHVLFISRSEADRLEQILAGLKGRSILTVGDTEGFAKRGVMIRFVTVDNKIRLRINLERANAANLKISSKLLRPAELVTTGQD